MPFLVHRWNYIYIIYIDYSMNYQFFVVQMRKCENAVLDAVLDAADDCIRKERNFV